MIEELREYLVPIGQMSPGTVFLYKGRRYVKLAGSCIADDGWNVSEAALETVGRVIGRIEQTPGWFEVVGEE